MIARKQINEEAVVEMYKDGYTFSDIAKATFCSASKVRNILKSKNIEIRKRGRQLTYVCDNVIIDEYNNGYTIIEIADMHGVSYSTVYRVLSMNNIKCRGKKRSELDEDLIMRLYREGKSASYIGREVGCNYKTVIRRIKSRT